MVRHDPEGLDLPSELDEEEDEGGSAAQGGIEGINTHAETGAGEAEAARGAGAPDAAVKANTLNRCIARFIDILIALFLARLPGYIGFFSGLLYIGIADGVMKGRSVGKRIAGLRVYSKKTGNRADFRLSILRNSTIGVFYCLSLIPFVGWAAGLLGLGVELLLIIGSPEGMRLGDEIALTVVRDEE